MLHGKSINGFDLDGASIPAREITSGGPPRDGIPALNDPMFVAAEAASFMRGDDRVLGVVIGGVARAYPIKILNWHEIVNDRIGQQFLVVTYCPLCGSGMVFASNVQSGRLQFGVSGLLYNSDVLMFDRNTESLWSQLMGESVAGKLKGTPLPQLPALHTTWANWRNVHPNTEVLSIDTGYQRNYEKSPYLDYTRTRKLYFGVSHKAPTTYHAKELVLGIVVNDLSKAYPFSELRKAGRTEFADKIGTETIQVFWDNASETAYATDQRGKILTTTVAYWFAWYAFHPQTDTFTAASP